MQKTGQHIGGRITLVLASGFFLNFAMVAVGVWAGGEKSVDVVTVEEAADDFIRTSDWPLTLRKNWTTCEDGPLVDLTVAGELETLQFEAVTDVSDLEDLNAFSDDILKIWGSQEATDALINWLDDSANFADASVGVENLGIDTVDGVAVIQGTELTWLVLYQAGQSPADHQAGRSANGLSSAEAFYLVPAYATGCTATVPGGHTCSCTASGSNSTCSAGTSSSGSGYWARCSDGSGSTSCTGSGGSCSCSSQPKQRVERN